VGFSHFKCLDLTRYPTLSLRHFAHLCARLRGIEVPVIPSSHPHLIHTVDAPIGSTDELISSSMSIRVTCVSSSSSSMRICIVYNSSIRRLRSSAHNESYNDLIRVYLQHPLFGRLQWMSKLKSIDFAVWMDSTTGRRIIERRLDVKYGLLCTVEPLPTPAEIVEATPVLSEAEYAVDTALAPLPPPLLAAAAAPAVGVVLPDVRVMNSIEIDVRSIDRFTECFPALEICSIHAFKEDDE
jgi:hypothetical protein